MKYNLIVPAIMSLHTSENVRCYFVCDRMNFSIFWHPQNNLQTWPLVIFLN